MPNKTDKELIEGYLNGDSHCFDELIRRYQNTISSICLSLLKNRADAKDISQEVCLKLARNGLEKFRFSSQFKTYLYSICKNESLTFRKRKAKEKHVYNSKEQNSSKHNEVSELLDNTEDVNESYRPRTQIDDEVIRTVINDALFSLSDAHREILLLTEFEEHSLKDAASLLGISESAVKSRRHEAKNKLAKLLEGQKEDLLDWMREKIKNNRQPFYYSDRLIY